MNPYEHRSQGCDVRLQVVVCVIFSGAMCYLWLFGICEAKLKKNAVLVIFVYKTVRGIMKCEVCFTNKQWAVCPLTINLLELCFFLILLLYFQ